MHQMHTCSVSVMPEPGGGGTVPPQYLADQLTLFQLEKGRLSPPITTGTPNCFHLPASPSVESNCMSFFEIKVACFK